MAGQVGQANPVHLLAPYGGAGGGARPNYIMSAGANPHMTSSTQASPTPKVAVNDIGSQEAFLAAIDETIKYFNDGDIVEGQSSRSIETRSCSISATRQRA